MKNKINVSIIVPIYNKEKFLKKSITSLLEQTLKNIEIILVNDGSTDRSLEICKKFAKNDKRIRVINQKNGGVSVARNKGIYIAKGEYIGFVDPDDWIEKDMFYNLYKNCINSDSEVSMCNYLVVYDGMETAINIPFREKIVQNSEIYEKIILNMIGPEDVITRNETIMGSACRLLIKKELIKKNKIIFPEHIPIMEDLVFCINVLTKTSKVYIDHSHYYNYNILKRSAVSKYRKNFLNLHLQAVFCIEKILEKEVLLRSSLKRLHNRYINIAISAINNEFHFDSKTNKITKIKNIKFICSSVKIKKAIKYYYNNLNYQNVFLSKHLDQTYKKIIIRCMKMEKINSIYYLTKLKNIYKSERGIK